MWIAQVKYSKDAIPFETEFKTKEEAYKFTVYRERNNPRVRWTRVYEGVKEFNVAMAED